MSLNRRSSSLAVILLNVGYAVSAAAEDCDISGEPPAWFVSRYPALAIENDVLRCTQPKGHAASFGIPFKGTAAPVNCRVRLGDANAINLRLEDGFRLFMAGGGLKRGFPAAKRTRSDTQRSPSAFMFTTCMPRCCSCLASTTNASPTASADATTA